MERASSAYKPSQTTSVGNNEEIGAHLTPRNTGENSLSSYYNVNGFADSQGRYYFMSSGYANYAVDILDGSTWSHLEVGEELAGPPLDMIEVQNGNIWVLTNYGAYQYDSNWEEISSYQLADSDTMSNQMQQGILDSQGRLWIYHQPDYSNNYDPETGQQEQVLEKIGGISVYDPDQETVIARSDTMDYEIIDNLSLAGAREMTVDDDGRVWVVVQPTDSTSSGIAVFEPSLNYVQSFTPDNSNLGDDIIAIAADYNGTVWGSLADSSIAYYEYSKWNNYDDTSEIFDSYCVDLTLGSDNQLYCAQEGSNVLVYDGSSWSEMPEIVDGQDFSAIETIVSNQDGSDMFLKNTSEKAGVFLKEEDTWAFYSTWSDNGLFSNVILGLSVDEKNGLWASGFYGTSYFDGTDWTYYDETDGLADKYSWKIHAASDGTVWFGTTGDDLSYLEEGEFHIVDEYPGFYGEGMYEDRDGNMWFGHYQTEDGGILMYDGEDFTHFPMDTRTIGGVVLSFAQGPDDFIYATSSTSTGLHLIQYDGDEWSKWSPYPDSVLTVGYTKLAADQEHNLWFLDEDGLRKWDGENLATYQFPEGKETGATEAMEVDSDGNIWMELSNRNNVSVGVFKVDEEEWVIHDLPNSQGIYDIKHDGNGNTWIASYPNGIYKFNAGITVPTESEPDTPERFTLEQNYPNPFNPTTNIVYNLPEAVNGITVSVYNVLGKKVATLVNGETQSAGQHQVTFDATEFSSGVYFYRIESKQFTTSKKMMLIK
ncbi:T9SS type A sorting domain-containing protein [Gracilimonas mengyeensis]|uniref:Periplasmic ligand-binding sensor domain-containing protein n=1 Tax=Gracilimonas mengyeensis TaxID=1302730 RepID=UPI001C8F3175|nr:T9SS type A sorting domain-containing protein [Gracilimonas mengyeensis]